MERGIRGVRTVLYFFDHIRNFLGLFRTTLDGRVDGYAAKSAAACFMPLEADFDGLLLGVYSLPWICMHVLIPDLSVLATSGLGH